MLYTSRIKNLTTAYPKLSRVWIKTDNPQMPLKGVWINDAELHGLAEPAGAADREHESNEVAEDHLAWRPEHLVPAAKSGGACLRREQWRR